MSRWVVVLAASVVLGACSDTGSGGQSTSTTTSPSSTSAQSHPPENGEEPGLAVVHIADGVFGWADEYMTVSNESIVVSGSASPTAVIDALERAAFRFMHVDETGVEHGPEVEGSPPLDSEGNELYTPNYVSSPTETPAGVRMYVDCKGVIDPRMRSRFLQILDEELRTVDGDVAVAVAD